MAESVKGESILLPAPQPMQFLLPEDIRPGIRDQRQPFAKSVATTLRVCWTSSVLCERAHPRHERCPGHARKHQEGRHQEDGLEQNCACMRKGDAIYRSEKER